MAFGTDAKGGITDIPTDKFVHGILSATTALKPGATHSIAGNKWNCVANCGDDNPIYLKFVSDIFEKNNNINNDLNMTMDILLATYNGKNIFFRFELDFYAKLDLKALIAFLGLFAGRNPFICMVHVAMGDKNDKWFYFNGDKITFYSEEKSSEFASCPRLSPTKIESLIAAGKPLPKKYVIIMPAKHIEQTWHYIETERDEIKQRNPDMRPNQVDDTLEIPQL